MQRSRAVPFETLGELNLLPLTAQAYIKAPSSRITADAQPLLTGLKKLYRLSKTPADIKRRRFRERSSRSGRIDVLNGTVDHCVWIALLAAKPDARWSPKYAMQWGKERSALLSVGFVPALSLPDPFADIGPRAAVKAVGR